MQNLQYPRPPTRLTLFIDKAQCRPRLSFQSTPIMWNDTDIPLAYFISFRTYGTWLHGDKRGSIDRFNSRYRSPYIAPNKNWRNHNEGLLKAKPLTLKARHRTSINKAIRETCDIRRWQLHAINVRTNHIHTVVAAGLKKPGIVLNALKANATRQASHQPPPSKLPTMQLSLQPTLLTTLKSSSASTTTTSSTASTTCLDWTSGRTTSPPAAPTPPA
jgi:hypothetical protein